LKCFKTEYFFLISALIFGFLFSVINPVLNNHDAEFHFDKCCYLTNCVVDRKAMNMTDDYYYGLRDSVTRIGRKEYFHKFFEKKAIFVKKTEVLYKGAVNITSRDFLQIVPAVGVKIGAFLCPTVGSMYIFGCLFNLLFYAVSLFFIIKWMSYGKRVLAMVALSPTFMTLAASLSYDGINFVLSSLFISLIIKLSINKSLSKKMLAGVSLASVLVYFSKPFSKWLLLLLVLLPFRNYRNVKTKLFFIKSLIIVCVPLFVGKFFYHIFRGSLHFGRFKKAVHHFLNTFIFYSGSKNVPTIEGSQHLIDNIVNGGLWVTGSVMPSWWTVLWFLLFFVVLFSEKKVIFERSEIQLPCRQRIMPLALGSGAIFFIHYFATIFGTLYIFDRFQNPEGEYYLSYCDCAVHGRYFTPFLLLFAISAQGTQARFVIKEKTIQILFSIFVFFSLAIYLWLILDLYYFYFFK